MFSKEIRIYCLKLYSHTGYYPANNQWPIWTTTLAATLLIQKNIKFKINTQ